MHEKPLLEELAEAHNVVGEKLVEALTLLAKEVGDLRRRVEKLEASDKATIIKEHSS